MDCPADSFSVYLLLCDNGHLYTGSARDLARRYRGHVTGRGRARYTRSFKPVRIVRAWAVSGSWGDTLRVEAFIKSLARPGKDDLVSHPETLALLVRAALGLTCELKPLPDGAGMEES